MTVTTAGPPPAGVYWQAVISASFGLTVEPSLDFKTKPDARFNIGVSPSIGMLPPQSFTLLLAPLISMAGGLRKPAAFSVGLTPKIGWIPCTATTLLVTPSIGMTGREVTHGSQVNTAVSRASTI